MFESLPNIVRDLKNTDCLDDLKKIRRGVEKESLRIDEAGYLSQKPHPTALGAAFTHDEITTDFSESLLEFITAPSTGLHDAVANLQRIHAFTVQHLDNEMLWPCSMPCVLTEDDEIPLAQYGQSNMARLKHLYRKGLGLRYGRAMQTIAGVHYNISYDADFLKQIHHHLKRTPTPDPVTDCYFGIIRNYHRVGWLIPYLFGASPNVCPSFFAHEPHRFPIEDKQYYAHPYAVSLRLSDIGYKNRTHDKMQIAYDDLKTYVSGLKQALLTVDPEFEALGVKQGEEWLQLNAHVLQIEAEFYGSIRPKRVPRPLERTVHALSERGVEYIEVRTLDLYPFSPVGVDERALRFLDILLFSCLLIDSPVILQAEQKQIDENLRKAVNEGRRPGITLSAHEKEIPLATLGQSITQSLACVADLLDEIYQVHDFSAALTEAQARLNDPRLLPSYQLASRMAAHGGNFFKMSMEIAHAHFDILKTMRLAPEIMIKMTQQAAESWRRAAAIEALPAEPFDLFMKHYFDPKRL